MKSHSLPKIPSPTHFPLSLSLHSFLSLHLSLSSHTGNQKHHEQPTNSARRSLKRKLEEDFKKDCKIVSLLSHDAHQDLVREVKEQVEILDSVFSSTEADRASAKRAIHVLSELAKNGNTNTS